MLFDEGGYAWIKGLCNLQVDQLTRRSWCLFLEGFVYLRNLFSYDIERGFEHVSIMPFSLSLSHMSRVEVAVPTN